MQNEGEVRIEPDTMLNNFFPELINNNNNTSESKFWHTSRIQFTEQFTIIYLSLCYPHNEFEALSACD